MKGIPVILPDAVEDIAGICKWYRLKLPELELRFQSDLDGSLERILKEPAVYAADEDGLRRVRMGKFPYHIGYLLDDDLVVVVGVIHTSRHPGIWKTRT